MPRLRGAIIGFGNVAAQGHCPAFATSADLDIVAVVDRSAARRAAALSLVPGAPRVFESIDDLAASGEVIDFVDIATPPSSHASLARFALEHRWHVACEKPLTLGSAEFARLAATARSVDRALFTMHNWKAAPILASAFRAVGDGRVGCVRHADVLVFRNQPCKGAPDGRRAAGGANDAGWRQDPAVAGGGILVDHGWHAFYLLLRLIGANPSAVSAHVTRPVHDPQGLDDSARVVITFPQADAFLHLTWLAPARRNALMVYGDGGTVIVDDDRLIVSSEGAPPEVTCFPTRLSAGSHHADWFALLLPEFVREVHDPHDRGANLREAGWCVALTEAAYRSGMTGGSRVPVPCLLRT